MTAVLIVVIIVLAIAVVVLARRSTEYSGYRRTHLRTEEEFAAANKKSQGISRRVVTGQVSEHLWPLLPSFIDRFNPREAKFLGQPIDYVIFEGMDDPRAEVTVHLVEVKTGKSRPSARERRIERAVSAGRVQYTTIRLDGYTEAVVYDKPVTGSVEDLGPHKFDENGDFIPDV